MDRNEYSEVIFTAIDEIVTARLSGLQYDITKMCTVIDDSQSRQGKYIVSDGTVRFEAYSTDTGFKNGNSVLVVIPNGDYNMQKTITGRVASTDTTPFKYTSPMDTMINITNNVLDEEIAEFGLRANSALDGSNAEPAPAISSAIYNSSTPGMSGFTRLGITADFRSMLNGLDVVKGQYGLKVLIYANGEKDIYELTLNTNDMIGNPYQFESYFSQEKVFDISHINTIERVEVLFYQDGKFVDGNNNPILWYAEDSFGTKEPLANNLFVKNVKIYLGYEYGKFTEETLMIYTNDGLEYSYSSGESIDKNIQIRWVHKIDDNNFELWNELPEGAELYWFRYQKGISAINKYAGLDWEEISEAKNKFSFNFSPDTEKQTEEIKAIGIIHSQEDDIEAESYYTSNLLIFQNKEEVPDQITLNASNALSIVCLDGSDGNYFLYDQNGNIINEGDGRGNIRKVEARFKGAEITSSLGKIDWLEWWFPYDEKDKGQYTMLYVDVNKEAPEDHFGVYNGVNYYKYIYKDLDVLGEKLIHAHSYSIKNRYSQSNSVNIVRCRLSIDGVVYEADKEFLFGKAGTNGTTNTFVLDIANNKDAIIADEEDVLVIEPHLYDSTGRRVDFIDTEISNISYSWYKNSDTEYMTLDEKKNDGSIFIHSKTNTVPVDNYYILQATYTPTAGYALTAFLPIAIKKSADIGYFEGAKQVIYNHQGVPDYYPHAYKVRNGEEEVKSEWQISYNVADDDINKSLLPSLKQYNNDEKALSASTFYAKGLNDKVCVYNDYWSQPILIIQDNYNFSMLNSWNGDLTIDEENGTILSTMLGAGHKNENNTFSGVLIGDVQKGTGLDGSSKLTGVYGFDQGVMSYSLTENGDATFGVPSNGQIKITGSEGTIRNAGYDNEENPSGINIDFYKGQIDIKKDNAQVLFQAVDNNNDPYALIKSNNGNELLHISNSEYYLQSDNYLSGVNAGSKFNLQNGSLEVKSSDGRVLLGTGNPFLDISVPTIDAEGLLEYGNSLFKLGNDEYYLRSKDYSGLKAKTIIVDGISYVLYKDTSGNEIYVKYENNIPIPYYKSNNTKVSISTSIPVVIYKDNGETAVETTETVSPEVARNYYISKLTAQYENYATAQGFSLDLKNNFIEGYDLTLKGTNRKNTNNTFILDSSNDTTPLKIGNKFSVNWDGTLKCNSVDSLNNDGRENYAISIGNNFYVTKGGGAGGGSCSFGGGSFGSLGAGDATLEKLSVTKNFSCYGSTASWSKCYVLGSGRMDSYYKKEDITASLNYHYIYGRVSGTASGKTESGEEVTITLSNLPVSLYHSSVHPGGTPASFTTRDLSLSEPSGFLSILEERVLSSFGVG